MLDKILPLLLLSILAPSAKSLQVPEWSKSYSVYGTLYIPFAELEEPFAAFADLENGKSRIDHYGEMEKTFQRADLGQYGMMLKVVPMTDENVVNQINCFRVDGTEDSPVKTQSILPDLVGFQYSGDVLVAGDTCQKWSKLETIGNKENRYTMILKLLQSPLKPSLSIAVPVRYEMKGYNTLLGSHYDHYYLDYTNFSPDTPDALVFDEFNKTSQCHDWPGPGHTRIHVMNPMHEFVNNHDDHVENSFAEFVNKHNKEYQDEKDKETKKNSYRQNLRYIHSTNRKNLSYKLAPNHLADLNDNDFKVLRGRLPISGYNGGKTFRFSSYDVNGAPDTLDWRLYGAVSPVRDQSVCGSCWSFGTVGTLEGANFLATGKLVALSEQALIDCSWGFGNNGCDGGEDFRVYQFMMKHGGIPTANSYGGYLGADGYCHLNDSNIEIGFQIEDYVNVTSGSAEALKVAIAKHGPVSVAIDASHKSFVFYSSGVYYEPECGNTTDSLDHAVLAVGYGNLDGQDYWLVKNSWSTLWGNDGYVLFSQRDNNCGVTTAATFVIPKKAQGKNRKKKLN